MRTKTIRRILAAAVTLALAVSACSCAAAAGNQGKMDPVYCSPEMYGAAGNGKKDDTAAVQKCIDEAAKQNVAVRGFGFYRTTRTVVISGEYQNVYFHRLDYRGAGVAMILRGQYNRVEIDYLDAYHSQRASGFRLETSETEHANYNEITIGELYAVGNSLEFMNPYGKPDGGQQMYYNRFTTSKLYSREADCILIEAGGQCAENSFTGKHVSCKNGWAIRCVGEGNNHTNRFYEFCFEYDCRCGLYGTGQLINVRTGECMGKKRAGSEEGTIVRVPAGQSAQDVTLINTSVDYVCVDVSEALSYDDCLSGIREAYEAGESKSEARGHFFPRRSGSYTVAEQCTRLWNYYAVAGENRQKASQRPVPGKLIAYYNHKGFVPDRAWYHRITVPEYTPIETDGCVPTEFDMAVSGTIRLEDSYCSVGICEITVTQYEGRKATVYSKDGVLIFDGTAQPEGTYRLRCATDPFDMLILTRKGLISFGQEETTGIYNGTNDRWTAERVNTL